MIPPFMFATGIENSYPTLNGGAYRVDEMAKCGRYENWRTDFDSVEELGLGVLRYGPPLHRTGLGPGRYDWESADQTFGELLRRDITPMAGLCHFGVPDWVGNFQNPDSRNCLPDTREPSPSATAGFSSTRRSTRCSSARPSRVLTAGGPSS